MSHPKTDAEKVLDRLEAGEFVDVHLEILPLIKATVAAGEMLAEQVRDMLDECSDDARAAALRAWREIYATPRW